MLPFLSQLVNVFIFSSLVQPSLLPDTWTCWRLISWLGFIPSLPVTLPLFLSHTHTRTHTAHTHTVISPYGMLHAPRDPPLISKAPNAALPKNWFCVSKPELFTEDYLYKAATHELVSCLIDPPFLAVQPLHSLLLATPWRVHFGKHHPWERSVRGPLTSPLLKL